MQEIYEQVIKEDPEMEEFLNSSGEDKAKNTEEYSKKPSIAKLHLEKIIEKSPDKISYEKWSTKPESSAEYFFEDIIRCYQIDENLEKGPGSCDKYEFVMNLLKQREEHRKNLITELDLLKERFKSIESKNQVLDQKNSDLEEKIKQLRLGSLKLSEEKSALLENLQILSESFKRLSEENSDLVKSSIQKFEEYEEKIKNLENECRSSSRLNFSQSFESDSNYSFQNSTEFSESELRNSAMAIVPCQVGEYINRLLAKISKLASKAKKLRLQREKLKFILESTRKSLIYTDLNG